jgi:hypothetical protein
MPVALPPPPGTRVQRPQRAHAVWQAAVDIADGATEDSPADMVALLRTAAFDPSTLQHALTLGRTRVRREPHDQRLRRGRQLLVHATEWLGSRRHAGEVGAERPRTAATPHLPPSTAPQAGERTS